MEYRRLGRTGLKVSSLCLGTMIYGSQVDQETSIKILRRAFDAGINLFDTAEIYVNGRSEEILGKAFREHRQEVVIATKVSGPPEDWTGPAAVNAMGHSRKHILDAVDGSLRRLGTGYIDLYQTHWPDMETPLEETLRTLDDLVRAGKVRYLGCSNYPAWLLAKALWISDVRNLARYESSQPRYNLLDRRIEREEVPLCLDQGVGILPYSPLGEGLLTGKYRRGQPPPAGARLGKERYSRMLSEGNLAAVERMCQLAEARGVTPGQFALAWVLRNPAVSSAIIGASSVAQLEESLGAVGLELTPEEVAACDEVSKMVGVVT